MKPVTIGDAVLYNADCLEVLAALEDGCADMIFTDPPYGLGKPIANDGAEAEPLFESVVNMAPRLLAKGGCCCCCCGGGGPDPMFARWSLILDKPLQFKQMVVWDKGPMGMGWHYRRSYETVLVAQKKGGACKWYDTTDAIENIIRPGYRGIRKIIPSADDHPTPKPPELAAHFIRLHTLPGEVVLDPFMGRGSTGIAARQLGRKFIGVEIDPEHFDHAVRRLEASNEHPDMFIEPPKKAVQEPLL